MSTPLLLLIGVILLAVVLLLFLPFQGSSRRNDGSSTDRQYTGPIFREDDRYWYGGLFYYNPDDPDPLIPKRYGWGWTLNFASPAAKVILVVMALMILLPVIIAVLGVHLTPIGCHPSGCSNP